MCFQYWPYYFVSVAVFLPRPRQNTGHLNKILVPILKTRVILSIYMVGGCPSNTDIENLGWLDFGLLSVVKPEILDIRRVYWIIVFRNYKYHTLRPIEHDIIADA